MNGYAHKQIDPHQLLGRFPHEAQTGGGLLNISMAQCFYKESKTILHKPQTVLGYKYFITNVNRNIIYNFYNEG